MGGMEHCMDMPSRTWNTQNSMKRRGGGGGMCRYLLDDWGVEAVKAAVQPDALREK